MTTKATYEIEQLKTGNDQVNTTEVTIPIGQVIAKHVPLGVVTASGAVIESKSGANDGSQNPIYISAYDIDTTSSAGKAQVIKSGTFTPTGLVWDVSFTAVQKLTAFVGTSISLQETDKV